VTTTIVFFLSCQIRAGGRRKVLARQRVAAGAQRARPSKTLGWRQGPVERDPLLACRRKLVHVGVVEFSPGPLAQGEFLHPCAARSPPVPASSFQLKSTVVHGVRATGTGRFLEHHHAPPLPGPDRVPRPHHLPRVRLLQAVDNVHRVDLPQAVLDRRGRQFPFATSEAETSSRAVHAPRTGAEMLVVTCCTSFRRPHHP